VAHAPSDKQAAVEQPSVDLSKLPSIESISATTDIRGFLAPGVPLELTRAALRRAWVEDPNIRTFIGIAENQWDFTAPETIPGFGPLKAVDDVRRLVADVFGDVSDIAQAAGGTSGDRVAASSAQPVTWSAESGPSTAEVEQTSACGPAPEVSRAPDLIAAADAPAASVDVLQTEDDDVAVHNSSTDHESVTPSRPRRHGSALPK
jgi:hypothetical protein